MTGAHTTESFPGPSGPAGRIGFDPPTVALPVAQAHRTMLPRERSRSLEPSVVCAAIAMCLLAIGVIVGLITL